MVRTNKVVKWVSWVGGEGFFLGAGGFFSSLLDGEGSEGSSQGNNIYLGVE